MEELLKFRDLETQAMSRKAIYEDSTLKAFMNADYVTQIQMSYVDYRNGRWSGIYTPPHHINVKSCNDFLRVVDNDDWVIPVPIERHMAMHMTLFSQSLAIADYTEDEIPSYWFWANLTPVSKFAQVYVQMTFPNRKDLFLRKFADPHPKIINGERVFTYNEWHQYERVVDMVRNHEPDFLKYLAEWSYKYSKDCPVEIDPFPGSTNYSTTVSKGYLNETRKKWFEVIYNDLFD